MLSSRSCTSSQTSHCATPRASGCAACASALRRRRCACETWLPERNDGDDRDQRPCSTQETGIVSFDFASTRTLTLRMRFCFAPTSSSPSYSSTRSSSGFSTTSSGTLPASSTSVMRRPRGQRLVERDVVGDRVAAGEERCDDDAAVLHGLAELEVRDHRK